MNYATETSARWMKLVKKGAEVLASKTDSLKDITEIVPTDFDTDG